jgi:hypothetical protein
VKRASVWAGLSVLLLAACGGGEPVTEVVQPPNSPVQAPPPSTPTPVTGNATLSWIPPTQNEDGSALTNLAGYRIYYGTSASNLNQTINLTNPGLTRYVVENLSGGTWYFGIRAYSSNGAESAMSAIASKTIS